MNTIVLHNRIQDIINSYLVLAGVYTMMVVEQTQGYRISWRNQTNSISLCLHNYLLFIFFFYSLQRHLHLGLIYHGHFFRTAWGQCQ